MKYLFSFFAIFVFQLSDAQVISTVARVNSADGLAFDSKFNLYFTDQAQHKICMIDSNGVIHTIAGTGRNSFNGDNIPATTANLNQPTGIAIDKHDFIYVSDYNQRIRKVNPFTGIITTVCGNGSSISGGDGGPATAATVRYPQGLCFDKKGNLYIADQNKIRKIDTFGTISTIAGNGNLGEIGDGGPATAALVSAQNVEVDDSGYVYISSFVVRKIDLNGMISTIAGDSSNRSYGGDNGPATAARLIPGYLKHDGKHRILYVGDVYNNRLRYIDSNGIIRTLAGNGTCGFSGDGGRPDTAEVCTVSGIALDSCGNVYFGHTNFASIRKITFDTTCGRRPTLTVGKVFNSPQNLTLSPNPAITTFTITAPVAITTVTITNLLGQAVLNTTGTGTQMELNIAHLPAGAYLVRVNGVYVQRLVKVE